MTSHSEQRIYKSSEPFDWGSDDSKLQSTKNPGGQPGKNSAQTFGHDRLGGASDAALPRPHTVAPGLLLRAPRVSKPGRVRRRAASEGTQALLASDGVERRSTPRPAALVGCGPGTMVVYKAGGRSAAPSSGRRKKQGPVGTMSDAFTSAMNREVAKAVKQTAKAATRTAGSFMSQQSQGQSASRSSASRQRRPASLSSGSGGGIMGSATSKDAITSRKSTFSLVVGPAAAGFQVLYDVELTPADTSLFPGQSYLANVHDRYIMESLTFKYSPNVTPYTTPNGKVWMVWYADANTNTPSALVEIESVPNKTTCVPYQSCSLSIPASGVLATSTNTSVVDLANSRCHGRLVVIADCDAASTNMGLLHVSSRIKFMGFHPPVDAPAANVVSAFLQINRGAKPLLASTTTGDLYFPGSAGVGVPQVRQNTGVFSTASATYDAATNMFGVAFDTTGLPLGTVIQMTRMAGKEQQNCDYSSTKHWVEGGAGADPMLDGGWSDLAGNLANVSMMPFGAAPGHSSVSMPRNPKYTASAVLGNQVATVVTYMLVVSQGLCAVECSAPCSAYDGTPAAEFDDWGWSVGLSLAGLDVVAAKEELQARSSTKSQLNWADYRVKAAPGVAPNTNPIPYGVLPGARSKKVEGEPSGASDGSGGGQPASARGPWDGPSGGEDDADDAAFQEAVYARAGREVARANGVIPAPLRGNGGNWTLPPLASGTGGSWWEGATTAAAETVAWASGLIPIPSLERVRDVVAAYFLQRQTAAFEAGFEAYMVSAGHEGVLYNTSINALEGPGLAAFQGFLLNSTVPELASSLPAPLSGCSGKFVTNAVIHGGQGGKSKQTGAPLAPLPKIEVLEKKAAIEAQARVTKENLALAYLMARNKKDKNAVDAKCRNLGVTAAEPGPIKSHKEARLAIVPGKWLDPKPQSAAVAQKSKSNDQRAEEPGSRGTGDRRRSEPASGRPDAAEGGKGGKGQQVVKRKKTRRSGRAGKPESGKPELPRPHSVAQLGGAGDAASTSGSDGSSGSMDDVFSDDASNASSGVTGSSESGTGSEPSEAGGGDGDDDYDLGKAAREISARIREVSNFADAVDGSRLFTLESLFHPPAHEVSSLASGEGRLNVRLLKEWFVRDYVQRPSPDYGVFNQGGDPICGLAALWVAGGGTFTGKSGEEFLQSALEMVGGLNWGAVSIDTIMQEVHEDVDFPSLRQACGATVGMTTVLKPVCEAKGYNFACVSQDWATAARRKFVRDGLAGFGGDPGAVVMGHADKADEDWSVVTAHVLNTVSSDKDPRRPWALLVHTEAGYGHYELGVPRGSDSPEGSRVLGDCFAIAKWRDYSEFTTMSGRGGHRSIVDALVPELWTRFRSSTGAETVQLEVQTRESLGHRNSSVRAINFGLDTLTTQSATVHIRLTAYVDGIEEVHEVAVDKCLLITYIERVLRCRAAGRDEETAKTILSSCAGANINIGMRVSSMKIPLLVDMIGIEQFGQFSAQNFEDEVAGGGSVGVPLTVRYTVSGAFEWFLSVVSIAAVLAGFFRATEVNPCGPIGAAIVCVAVAVFWWWPLQTWLPFRRRYIGRMSRLHRHPAGMPGSRDLGQLPAFAGPPTVPLPHVSPAVAGLQGVGQTDPDLLAIGVTEPVGPLKPLNLPRSVTEGDDAMFLDGEKITASMVEKFALDLSMFLRSARGLVPFLSVMYDERGRYYADPLKLVLRLSYTKTGVRLNRNKQLFLLRCKATSCMDTFGHYPIVGEFCAWVFRQTESAVEFKSWRRYVDTWKKEHLIRLRSRCPVVVKVDWEQRCVLAEGIGEIEPIPVAVQLAAEEKIRKGDMSFVDLLRDSPHFFPALESGTLLSTSLEAPLPVDPPSLKDFLTVLDSPAAGSRKCRVEGLGSAPEKSSFVSPCVFSWSVDDRNLQVSKFEAALANQLDGSGNRLERVLPSAAVLNCGQQVPVAGFPLGPLKSVEGDLGAELITSGSTVTLAAAIVSRQMSKAIVGSHSCHELSELEQVFVRRTLPVLETMCLLCADALHEVVERDPVEFFTEHYVPLKGRTWVDAKVADYERYKAGEMGSREKKIYLSRRSFVKCEGNTKISIVKGRRTATSRPRAIMMMNDVQLIEQCQSVVLFGVFNREVGRRFQKKADNPEEFKERVTGMLYRASTVTSLDVSAFEASVSPERKIFEHYAATRLCQIAGFTRTLKSLQSRWAEEQVLINAGGLIFRIESRLSGDFETSFGNGVLMLSFQKILIDMSNDAGLCAEIMNASANVDPA